MAYHESTSQRDVVVQYRLLIISITCVFSLLISVCTMALVCYIHYIVHDVERVHNEEDNRRHEAVEALNSKEHVGRCPEKSSSCHNMNAQRCDELCNV